MDNIKMQLKEIENEVMEGIRQARHTKYKKVKLSL